jgi:tetratricopeptide (TPR) repeat protein
MAWWGIAVASGPHINNPIVPEDRARAAWEAVTKARSLVDDSVPIEKALIDAQTHRFADPPPQDRRSLDEAYAAAMRKVWQAYPEDADVGSLFAESMMDLRPWDLWQQNGQPQPGTEEIVATLEAVISKSPNHPLALHLYIHAVEASHSPDRAADEADRLRTLQPGLGHLVHMPSHIDVRQGRWAAAIKANQLAIAADRKYREKVPRQGFYHVYMAHNPHMLAFAAMMRGQSRLATTTINEMAAGIPAEWIRENAPIADGFLAMPLEVLVRFGRWDKILAAPEPPENLPLSRCMWRCARGVAHAAKGQVEMARAEQSAFVTALAAIPPDAIFSNNKAHDLMGVAQQLLEGEIRYRAGDVEGGIAALREAIRREDMLRYAEPPDWIHPVRHALGALLLRENRIAEAEQLYREDLARLPNNGWSLYGLSRCLQLQGKADLAQEFQTRFQQVWNEADVTITSSCFCLPGTAQR